MRAMKTLVIAMHFAVAAGACEDGGDTSPVESGEAVPALEELLAHLEIAGEELDFMRVGDGPDQVLVIESTGAVGKPSLLGQLEAEYGELTMLETYYALRPGAEAPAALIASHARESAAIGRVDTRVRRLDFQADTQAGRFVLTKASNPCDAANFFHSGLAWSNKIVAASPAGDAYVCVSSASNPQMGLGQPNSNTCTFYTTLRKMAGICRPESASMITYFGMGSQGGPWNTTASQTLNSGHWRRWDMSASSTPKRLAAVGLAAQGWPFGMRSGTAR